MSSQELEPEINRNDDEETYLRYQSVGRTYAAFAAMCIVVLTESLDATSIAVILPSIAQSLRSSTTATFSFGISFLLASTVFQPIFASLSYVLGRKHVLLGGLALFLAGAIIAAVAGSTVVLLIGRTIQGVGAAGTISVTVIIVTDLVPLRQRPQWIGLLNGMWAIGSVTGPVIGGAFAAVDWHWIFWINIPLVVISSTGVVLCLRSSTPEGSLYSKFGRLDWVGAGLFLPSTTAFFLALTFGGTAYPWSSTQILLPLVLGIVGISMFVVHQRSIASHPLIHLSVFANFTANIGHLGTVIHGLLLWMLLYYLPLFYEGVLGYSPLITGIATFPETFTVAPAAIGTGISISMTGSYRWAVWCGWLLTTLGIGLLCLLNENTSVVQWVFINLTAGIGLGMLVPAISCQIQAATKDDDAGYAISMFSFLRASGQTIGVAVGGTIFQNQLKFGVLASDQSSSVTAEGLLEVLRSLSNDTSQKNEVKMEVVNALRIVWATGCALSAAISILNIWIKDISLDRNVATDAGAEKKPDVEQLEIEL